VREVARECDVARRRGILHLRAVSTETRHRAPARELDRTIDQPAVARHARRRDHRRAAELSRRRGSEERLAPPVVAARGGAVFEQAEDMHVHVPEVRQRLVDVDIENRGFDRGAHTHAVARLRVLFFSIAGDDAPVQLARDARDRAGAPEPAGRKLVVDAAVGVHEVAHLRSGSEQNSRSNGMPSQPFIEGSSGSRARWYDCDAESFVARRTWMTQGTLGRRRSRPTRPLTSMTSIVFSSVSLGRKK